MAKSELSYPEGAHMSAAIECDDPQLRQTFDEVVARINDTTTKVLGEHYDLLEELTSLEASRAGYLTKITFGEISEKAAAVGCTSIPIGVSVELEPSACIVRFSTALLRKLP